MSAYSKLKERTFTGLALTATFISLYLWLPAWILSIFLMVALGIILFVEWPKIGISALTPWYPILPFLLLVVLNHSVQHRRLLPAIFIITAAFDVGSYFVGSFCGKRKLAPVISPGKTWEGVFGGFVFSLISATLLLPSIRSQHLFSTWVGLIVLADIAALSGDLFVSFLKRRAGIKDCGNLLPGHGGLLDRFDSIMFVTVLFFLLRFYI